MQFPEGPVLGSGFLPEELSPPSPIFPPPAALLSIAATHRKPAALLQLLGPTFSGLHTFLLHW